MEDVDPDAIIVIRREQVDFRSPVIADFLARSAEVDPGQMSAFLDQFRTRGRARIAISADLYHRGEQESRARFVGDFVVLRPEAG